MSTREIRLRKTLRRFIKDDPNSLQAAVAKEALGCGYKIEPFFCDLCQHGCASGMIGALIYYFDTHAFYDEHYAEIEDIRLELEDALGESLHPIGDLKNWYAWMAFEETARAMQGKLGLDKYLHMECPMFFAFFAKSM